MVGLKMWSWSYPETKYLSSVQPFVALSLPYIAFAESYWEATVAGLEEAETRVQVAAVR